MFLLAKGLAVGGFIVSQTIGRDPLDDTWVSQKVTKNSGFGPKLYWMILSLIGICRILIFCSEKYEFVGGARVTIVLIIASGSTYFSNSIILCDNL